MKCIPVFHSYTFLANPVILRILSYFKARYSWTRRRNKENSLTRIFLYSSLSFFYVIFFPIFHLPAFHRMISWRLGNIFGYNYRKIFRNYFRNIMQNFKYDIFLFRLLDFNGDFFKFCKCALSYINFGKAFVILSVHLRYIFACRENIRTVTFFCTLCVQRFDSWIRSTRWNE